MNDTTGQQKVSATTPHLPIWIENRDDTKAELCVLVHQPGEVYIKKQRFDVVPGSRNTTRVFDILLDGKDDVIVYGVVTEVCVDQDIPALEDRPIRVHVHLMPLLH
jgi:hypothetical protein